MGLTQYSVTKLCFTLNKTFMRFLLSLVVVFTEFSTTVLSQNKITLKGLVKDSLSKEPLAFSYVTVNGIALGTVTNGDGEFVLNIPYEYQTKSIVFLYLGYKRKFLKVSQLQQMDPLVVSLIEDVTQISEVIIKPRKKISAKQLLKKVIKNIEVNYAQYPLS